MVQTVVDPATGQTIQTMAPVSNGGDGSTPVQVVTVQDPVTGQLTQQIVQTAVDPTTGEIMQIPLQNGSTIHYYIFSVWVVNIYYFHMSTGNSQVITVTDPNTGQPVQQIVQTVTDPKTGATSQVVVPNAATSGQIVTTTDPVTGQPVQQIVHTDPKTGKTTIVPMAAQPGIHYSLISHAISQRHFSKMNFSGNQQIITVTDPATGQPVQQIMQTQIDPKTGKAIQVATPLPSNSNNAQVITIQDPVTGQMKQQLVQTVVDPKTGQMSQIPINNNNQGIITQLLCNFLPKGHSLTSGLQALANRSLLSLIQTQENLYNKLFKQKLIPKLENQLKWLQLFQQVIMLEHLKSSQLLILKLESRCNKWYRQLLILKLVKLSRYLFPHLLELKLSWYLTLLLGNLFHKWYKLWWIQRLESRYRSLCLLKVKQPLTQRLAKQCKSLLEGRSLL